MKTSATRAVPRFFAPVELSPGAEIRLPESAARHCAVLRLRCGDAVTVFNGEGGEFAAELTRVSRDDARAGVISKRAVERNRRSPSRSLSAYRAAIEWTLPCRNPPSLASPESFRSR